MIGGSITTSAAYVRSTEVYDLRVGTNPASGISISNVAFSKWKGAIANAKSSKSVSQRVLGVTNGNAAATLGATALTGSVQDIPGTSPSVTQPDVYRVLSVKGNQSGMNQTVTISGTNWVGEDIAEDIVLLNADEVKGNKAFMTVTEIRLPAKNSDGETVSVGRTNKLGLYYPLFEDTDVIEWSKLDSTTGSYVVQTGTLGVDEIWATVKPVSIGLTDSFEFSLVTP